MDVLENEILSVDSTNGVTRHRLPCKAVTAMRRRASGGFVVATDSGVAHVDDGLETFEYIVVLDEDPMIRANDGGCDPLGAFVVGTMSIDERPGAGALYRVTPHLHVDKILSNVSISNGLQWSSDGRHSFYIDTLCRRVDIFDVDLMSGAWSNRRTHIEIPESAGFPDGMAIDDEGGLWVALWGGGGVMHFDSSGGPVELIRVPGVTQVSSCAFGGDNLNTLFITTSRQGLPEGDEPMAGALFAAQTSARGAALHEFAG